MGNSLLFLAFLAEESPPPGPHSTLSGVEVQLTFIRKGLRAAVTLETGIRGLHFGDCEYKYENSSSITVTPLVLSDYFSAEKKNSEQPYFSLKKNSESNQHKITLFDTHHDHFKTKFVSTQ